MTIDQFKEEHKNDVLVVETSILSPGDEIVYWDHSIMGPIYDTVQSLDMTFFFMFHTKGGQLISTLASYVYLIKKGVEETAPCSCGARHEPVKKDYHYSFCPCFKSKEE